MTGRPYKPSTAIDRDAFAALLGVRPETLPDLSAGADEESALVPSYAPLTDSEWRRIQPFVPPRVKCNSKIADRDFIDFALLAARSGFTWSVLQDLMPVEAVRAKMKRFSIYRTGSLWTELYDHVKGVFGAHRVAAFKILADRSERERASVMDFRNRKRKTVLKGVGA